MPKTTPREESASVESQKANVHLEIDAHSSMTRTRKAMGSDDLVHVLRQAHRTEVRKVTEKVVMTDALVTHHNLLVKVRPGEAKETTLYKLQERKSPKEIFI